MENFGPALKESDQLFMTDIYAAGEAPLPGIDLNNLATKIAASLAGDKITKVATYRSIA